jgi:hypothetical protein
MANATLADAARKILNADHGSASTSPWRAAVPPASGGAMGGTCGLRLSSEPS